MLIIWSLVGLKIFKVSKTNEDLVPVMVEQKSDGSGFITKQPFLLTELERNPFEPENAMKLVTKPVKEAVKKEKPVFREVSKSSDEKYIWPKIFYYGFVETDGKNRLAVIKLDNIMKRIRVGEVINEDLELHKIFRDSVIIKRKSELKIISRHREMKK